MRKPLTGWWRDLTRSGRPELTETAREGEPLVDRLRRRETGAIEELVDRYGAWIHRVAGRLLDDRRDAEEVTPDVLLTVVQRIQQFKGEAAFSSWIYRIAVNAARGRLRSRRARPEVSLEPLLPVFDEEGRLAGPVTDGSGQRKDPALAAEARAATEQAVARLPEEYRAIVLLRDVEGLANKEVAQLLNLTVAAARSRLHRARLALRQALAHLLPPGRWPASKALRAAGAGGGPRAAGS